LNLAGGNAEIGALGVTGISVERWQGHAILHGQQLHTQQVPIDTLTIDGLLSGQDKGSSPEKRRAGIKDSKSMARSR